MDKVLIITRIILKRMFHKKLSNYLLFILLPIALSIGMFMLFSIDDNQTVAIGFVDLDNTASSRSITTSIHQSEELKIVRLTQKQMKEYIAKQHITFGYVIPKGFESTILSGQDPSIDMMIIDQNSSITWITAITNTHIDYLKALAKSANYERQAMYQLMDNIKEGYTRIEPVTVDDESKVKSATVRTFGNYMIVLLLTAFLIAFQILEEKRAGTFGRIIMSPVHPKSYIVANIIANLLVIMIQIAVVMVALSLILGSSVFVNPFMIYFIFLIFALCGISLGVLLAAFAKNTNAAGALISIVISPSCMLAGCFWPIELMPDYMQRIAYITPQRWTLDAINMIQMNRRVVDVIPHLIVVLSFTALFFLLSVYSFKNEDKVTS